MTSKLFEKDNEIEEAEIEPGSVLMSSLLDPIISQLISSFPIMFEKVLGRKLPPVVPSELVRDIQTLLKSNEDKLQKVLNQQNIIADEILKIKEGVAKNSTDIDNKFQNIRLTRQRETQTAEYNNPSNLQNLE
jgi:hypothetical protein